MPSRSGRTSANSQFIVSNPGSALTTSIPGATGSGTDSVAIPFASVGGSQLFVITSSGDDSLTIDLSVGLFAKAVNFYGGSQTTGDSLALTGGGIFTSVAHTFASSASGSVAAVGNALVAYGGLEPITDNLNAAARSFTFEGGTETITLADAAGANMTIDSSLGEVVTFATPTLSLSVNSGSGSDTISFNSVDAAFAGVVTIDGGAAADAVTLAADLTLAAGNHLTVAAETIAVSPAADLATSGGGAISSRLTMSPSRRPPLLMPGSVTCPSKLPPPPAKSIWAAKSPAASA